MLLVQLRIAPASTRPRHGPRVVRRRAMAAQAAAPRAQQQQASSLTGGEAARMAGLGRSPVSRRSP
jgi:hypothetical protein